jgi:3-oxoacyl-(acyl-carrier-protein) synthase
MTNSSKSKDALAPRVAVVGLGVVAPNGHGTEAFAKALEKGESGIRFIKKLEELGFGCQVGGIPQNVREKALDYLSENDLFATNESMLYSCVAAIDAWRDARLQLTPADEDFVNEDTGAIIGTGIGGIDTLGEKVVPMVNDGKVRRMGSTIVEQVMASSVSARIGGILALGNQVTTNSSACSTGTEAIIMGAQRIQAGQAKRMVCGGAEGSSYYSWGGFDSMRVLSRKFNDKPEQASRPMSASACGFVPGSGAGVLILEELASAKARGVPIYAELLGSSINSGGMRFGGSMTAPSAKSVKRCVRDAIIKSGIRATDIDYVNGHLTATFADPHEVKNWSEALELGPADFPYINSTKSMIGHALGAAGAIECVATILQLNRGFVHGSLNCDDLHETIAPYSKSVVRDSIQKNIDIAIKASFGFGDVNSCIIFKKWEPGT